MHKALSTSAQAKEGRCGGRLPGVSCLALYHVGLSLFLKSTYDYFVKDKLTDLAKNGRIWSRMERLADLEQGDDGAAFCHNNKRAEVEGLMEEEME